jgi:hypothetical protein
MSFDEAVLRLDSRTRNFGKLLKLELQSNL